jgi:hypothetical protein
MTGTPGSKDRYDTEAPLYRQIAQLSALRAANPALADGAQVHRYASDGAGIFAAQPCRRADRHRVPRRGQQRHHRQDRDLRHVQPEDGLQPAVRADTTLRSGRDSRVDVTVAPLSVSVWKARSAMAHRKVAPAVHLTSPQPGGVVGRPRRDRRGDPRERLRPGHLRLPAVGTKAWTTLGTDDNAPYRVFQDVTSTPRAPCWSTARRQGQQRQRLRRLVVRHRR